MKTCSAILLAFALVLAAALPAAAQIRITGGISGTVTDQTDAVVPGASVQLTDEGTGVVWNAVTNTSGFFQFPDINHGSYSLTVTLQGFQTAVFVGQDGSPHPGIVRLPPPNPAHAAALAIPCGVRGHGEDPAAHVGQLTAGLQVPEQLQERFLDDVFRVGVMAHEHRREPIHRGSVRLEQFPRCL